MFTLACKNLGNFACPFVAKAEMEDIAIAKMIKHAKREHAEDIAGMGSMDEVARIMLAKVKNI
jgi:predicted small metal-binding protein